MPIEIMNLRVNKPTEPFDVKIDRTSPLGNPWPMHRESVRDDVCEHYEQWFKEQVKETRYTSFKSAIIHLIDTYREHGKLRLFCWCAPKRCHGETIKQYILNQK